MEVREKVLSDHARLRGMLAVLASLALRILRGDEDLATALRLKGEEIGGFLQVHMAWEEKFLVPTLVNLGALGEERARELLGDHRDQRHRLEASIAALACEPCVAAAELAKRMLGFVESLERDMLDEEAVTLAPDLLLSSSDPTAGKLQP
jgi:hypothetical protein